MSARRRPAAVVVYEAMDGADRDSLSRSHDALDQPGAAGADSGERAGGASRHPRALRRCASRSPFGGDPIIRDGTQATTIVRRGSLRRADAYGSRPAVKSPWKLPDVWTWTRRAHAHASLENYRTVFHELP